MKTKLENPKIERQRAAYTALLQNLGQAGFEQIQETLDERETVEAERSLSPDVVERLKKKIKAKK